MSHLVKLCVGLTLFGVPMSNVSQPCCLSSDWMKGLSLPGAAKTCFGYLFLWGFGGGCLFLISGVRAVAAIK